MKLSLLVILVVATGCEGIISGAVPVPPSAPVPVKAPPLVMTCKVRGGGLPARMRLLWTRAYVGEISTHLGPDFAAIASQVGLSPSITPGFAFQSSGSLLTEVTLDSLAATADAVAVAALSTDVRATAVFGCNARTVSGKEAHECFANFLKTKGARLLRRALTEAELTEHLAFFTAQSLQGESDGDQEGFRQGLASLLMHPDFLYVRDVPAGQTSALSPFSTAARLSFALTGAGPDDLLFAAALDGSLARPAVLRAQTQRLLETPQAKAQALGFYRQWLGYGRLAVSYSPAFLDGLDVTGLKDAATAELDAFVTDLTWNRGAKPGELLTSKLTAPLDPLLAKIYGASPGDTALPAARAGLLTRVGLLASGSDNWHVVGRGLPVLQNFLCRDLEPPSFSVAEAAKAAEQLRVSNVERMAAVTSAASCQSCHRTINPLGGARSDFDAVGRSVTVEKHYAGGVFDFEVPVVAKSELSAVFGKNAPFAGSLGLSAALAVAPEFQACFATQYVRHVLGRRDDADGCLADDAAITLAGGGTILETMTAVITSPEFVLWRD